MNELRLREIKEINQIDIFLNEKDEALSPIEENCEELNESAYVCKVHFNDSVFSDDELYEYISKYQNLMNS